MKNYIYSAKNNAFFELVKRELYDRADWDLSDAVEVDAAVFSEYTSVPPAGKQRVAGEDGLPAWVDVPPPTAAEMRVIAQAKINVLRAEADSVITPLADALAGDYIDDTDRPRLTAWQKYRYELTKIDPAKPEWPEKPE